MNGTQLQAQLVRNAEAYAANLPARGSFYRSKSGVVLFPPLEHEGEWSHGNLFRASYQEIRQNPQWSRLLEDKHPRRRGLRKPYCDNACDVDSCNSSKALLLSIFGWQQARCDQRLYELFGLHRAMNVDFEHPAWLELTNGRIEPRSTKLDMRVLGNEGGGHPLLHVEAKLSEADFTCKPSSKVENYARLDDVFDAGRLLHSGRYRHYQLIRNVLAAVQYDCRLCLLFDARRHDLLAEWDEVMAAIREDGVRNRCFTRTWQAVAACVPEPLAEFLRVKYGIDASVPERQS